MPVHPYLLDQVRHAVLTTPVDDIHTHLYDPAFGSLLLSGIDDLLVYHYLVSESFRQFDVPHDRFWAASKTEQADWIWRALFVDHSPVSEACRGVVTVLNAFGLDPRQRELGAIRRWFAQQSPAEHLERVLALAGVRSICMTNSPFEDEERPLWEQGFDRDPRFKAALRIDPLLLDWHRTAPRLRAWGYDVSTDRSGRTASEVRRFLADWSQRIQSRYCMVSLPPDFEYPADTDAAWLIRKAVLPHGREHGQAFALMLGVKRAVNPLLRLAGDSVGRSRLDALEHLCAENPENRFLATVLSREAQHETVVIARKFRNLHPFGCWWFTNTPQLIDEITRLRLELLGTSFTPQHSDARVLDQLVYKWRHTRECLIPALHARYAALASSGWNVTPDDIQRDVQHLLGGAFEQFLRAS